MLIILQLTINTHMSTHCVLAGHYSCPESGRLLVDVLESRLAHEDDRWQATKLIN